MSPRIHFASAAFPLAVLAAACAADAPLPDTAAVDVADSAGVVLVRNLAPPAETLEVAAPAVRIGGAADAPAEVAFGEVSDLDVLADGSVVVVDPLLVRVARFDSTGRWLGNLGRAGSGRGEHRMPLWVWTAGDTIAVWDFSSRRLSRFLAGGRFLRSDLVELRKATGLPTRPIAGGFLDERESGQLWDPEPARGVIVRLGPQGDVLDTIAGPYPVPEFGWEVVDEATGEGEMVNPPAFSAAPGWTVVGGNLAWTGGAEPRIEVSDPNGTLLRVITLPRARAETDDADRDAYVTALADHLGLDDVARAQLRRTTEFAAVKPTITALLADDRGGLWAATHDPGAPDGIGRDWDVLDADGRLLRRVRLPRGYRPLRVRAGRAYGISRAADGADVVDILDVAAPGAGRGG